MSDPSHQPEWPPSDARSYSPRSGGNCKSERRRSPEQDRQNRRARREYARLERGMTGHRCLSLVLTRGHCMSLDLRRNAWHHLLTRMRQRWPDVQAWTMYEYGRRRRGVHLHAVIYGVSGISVEWVAHVVGLLGDGTDALLGEVGGNRQFHVRYLTKQLADPKYFEGWPRHFRPVSVTRRWCPDWRRRRRRRA